MNIANLLTRAARTFPDNPAISRGPAVWATYAQLMHKVARMAAAFRDKLGLVPGDRVALAMTNCPQYLEIRYAVWCAGLIAVPMNAKLHANEFSYLLSDSGSRVAFATPDLIDAVAPLGGVLPELKRVIEVGSSEYVALARESRQIDVFPSAPDDVAWLFYTSGTTGRPKGVMISHRNLMCAAQSYFTDVDQVAAGECIVHAAPMSHGSGIYDCPHVLKAANQVTPESGHFSPEEVFSLCSRWGGASMFLAPTMVNRMVTYAREHSFDPVSDLAGLKTIVYGGGPMYVADIVEALRVMGPKFVQIYGMGEVPMTITALSREIISDSDHPRYLERLASVGVAQSPMQVIVADDHDQPLPIGEIGEILVRGDAAAQGYWRNEQASAQLLRNGWSHTGDVGSFDEDGFLTLRDRSKDMIISGGSNIYPREVEEILIQHPAVAEVSVVGRVSPEWGEEVVAFVVLQSNAGIKEEALDSFCLDRIARFKRPRHYHFVDGLPKNNYGKVVKTELRKLLATQLPGEAG